MKYRFSQLDTSHSGDLAKLRKALEHEGTLGPISMRQDAYGQDQIAQDLAWPSTTFGVLHQERLVGACTVKLISDFNTDGQYPKTETNCLIAGLLLAKEYQGTADQVARQLVLYSLTSDAANQGEVARLEIYVPASAPKTRARSLYKRLGFFEMEDEVKRYQEEGVEYQVIPMLLSPENFERIRVMHGKSRGVLPIE